MTPTQMAIMTVALSTSDDSTPVPAWLGWLLIGTMLTIVALTVYTFTKKDF